MEVVQNVVMASPGGLVKLDNTHVLKLETAVATQQFGKRGWHYNYHSYSNNHNHGNHTNDHLETQAQRRDRARHRRTAGSLRSLLVVCVKANEGRQHLPRSTLCPTGAGCLDKKEKLVITVAADTCTKHVATSTLSPANCE